MLIVLTVRFGVPLAYLLLNIGIESIQTVQHLRFKIMCNFEIDVGIS
jgi:hypothetical protein